MNESRVVNDFYQKYNEEERLGGKQGYVEYATTMAYIHKYLKPGMRIAEIGAGTGRSFACRESGYAGTYICGFRKRKRVD